METEIVEVLENIYTVLLFIQGGVFAILGLMLGTLVGKCFN